MKVAFKGLPPMIKRALHVISAIAVVTGIVFGVGAYETKFATAEDLKQVRQDILLLAKRLENKILEDKIHDFQRRVWSLEDRYGGTAVPEAPPAIKEQYRELRYTIDRAKIGLR